MCPATASVSQAPVWLRPGVARVSEASSRQPAFPGAPSKEKNPGASFLSRGTQRADPIHRRFQCSSSHLNCPLQDSSQPARPNLPDGSQRLPLLVERSLRGNRAPCPGRAHKGSHTKALRSHCPSTQALVSARLKESPRHPPGACRQPCRLFSSEPSSASSSCARGSPAQPCARSAEQMLPGTGCPEPSLP